MKASRHRNARVAATEQGQIPKEAGGHGQSDLDLKAITPFWVQLEAALSPIENDEQHDRALKLLDPVWEAVDGAADHPLGSLLMVMVERIAAYEEQRWPTEARPPGDRLAYLLEQRGLSQRELAAQVGIDQPVLSRLISGERPFTTGYIQKLAQHFRLDPGYFVA